MEFLDRSGGRRGGDTIELLAEPTTTVDGTSSCTFLVHGVRYNSEAEATIDSLRQGIS
jgi:hypothetical protein